MSDEVTSLSSGLDWQLACDAIEFPIVLFDTRLRVQRVNRCAVQLLHQPLQNLVGTSLRALGKGEPWRTGAILATRMLGGIESTSTHVIDKTSGCSWDVLLTPIKSTAAGVVAGALCAWNTTESAGSQRSLHEAQTTGKLNLLTAGIAHEVKNPLFAISATLDAFETKFSQMEDQGPYFAVIRDSVRRLDELTQQLVEYSDPTPLTTNSCDVTMIIEKAVQACAPMAANLQVGIVQRHATLLPPATVDPRRMQDAFRYLLEHALLRSSLGGVVTICANQCSARDWGRSCIQCVVEDCGPPVAAEDLPHVLEPFFKQRQASSGLRLAIAALTVQRHGTQVSVENRSDSSGMRFLVPLPCTELP